jgi:hypothetical protein
MTAFASARAAVSATVRRKGCKGPMCLVEMFGHGNSPKVPDPSETQSTIRAGSRRDIGRATLIIALAAIVTALVYSVVEVLP